MRVNPRIPSITLSKCALPLDVLRGETKAKEIKLSNQKLGPADAMVIGAMLKARKPGSPPAMGPHCALLCLAD